jgi:4-hydroxybenzoate polyprenyltransferase
MADPVTFRDFAMASMEGDGSVASGLLAFVGVSLAASSIYLLDDLVDLPRDRRHPVKKARPIASGRGVAAAAVLLVPLLVAGAIAAALALPGGYRAALAAYVVLMIAYVLRIRDLRVADALLLGCGYTLRIVAGSAATGLAVSTWVLACSALFFFSLALLKRYAEIALVGDFNGAIDHAHGYRGTDAPMVAAVGRAAGLAALAVLALSPLVDPAPELAPAQIASICVLLLFWTQRLWRLAGAGRIRDDPVMFALKDRLSVILGVAVLAIVVIGS